jgi:hypothetical protein
MKTTCLVLTMISCAALTHGPSYAALSNAASRQSTSKSRSNTVSGHPSVAEHAAPADDGKHQAGEKASNEQRDHRYASDKNHPASRASLTKANRPKVLRNNRERSTSANSMNLYQPGSEKSSGTARGGLIRNETVNTTLPVRPPSVVSRTGLLPNSLRHRGANPAVIRGSANSDSRKTGAINGTRMNRRL